MIQAKSIIRYAVIGAGHIAQVAVLPAFAHAKANSKLAAIVSGNPAKRRALAVRYGVPAYDYRALSDLLHSGSIDAVYIASPNAHHKEHAVQAARAGIHVLCEKPLSVTVQQAREMVLSAERHHVFLMTAYRLHFERMTLTALRLAHSGKLGELRFFNSTFSLPVKKGDIRTQRKLGGGSVYDLGIYCINAARHLFKSEPTDVLACSASRPDSRFRDIDEMTSVIMRFPGERLASFISSLGAADTSSYCVVGTKGLLCADPAYEYASHLKLTVTIGEKSRQVTYPQRDQFAAELLHFSSSIQKKRMPDTPGSEGLRDVLLIEAIYESARKRKWISLSPMPARRSLPNLRQEIYRPKVRKPELILASSASGEK